MDIFRLIVEILILILLVAILYQIGKVQFNIMEAYKRAAKADKLKLNHNILTAIRLETGAICEFLKGLTVTSVNPGKKAPTKNKVPTKKKGPAKKKTVKKK